MSQIDDEYAKRDAIRKAMICGACGKRLYPDPVPNRLVCRGSQMAIIMESDTLHEIFRAYFCDSNCLEQFIVKYNQRGIA